jgi:transcriptional regulator with XRE-family HTH domain
MEQASAVGIIVKTWRSRRRMSQLDLALEAEISSRHLSFIETGRSRPTRAMVLKIAEHLDVPLRERNTMLLAAGYSPEYADGERRDTGSAQVLETLRAMVDQLLPSPALIIDGGWNLVAANPMSGMLMQGVAPHLLTGAINVVRLSLHPEGLAPQIRNLAVWRAHLVERLERQLRQTDDTRLRQVLEEIQSFPAVDFSSSMTPAGPVVPLLLTMGGVELSFFSTTMVVGGPRDVVLSELAVELFLPADGQTRTWLEARGNALASAVASGLA